MRLGGLQLARGGTWGLGAGQGKGCGPKLSIYTVVQSFNSCLLDTGSGPSVGHAGDRDESRLGHCPQELPVQG